MDFLQKQAYLNDLGIRIDQATYERNQAQLVVVGMSGGVDSSVSALLLKLQGYQLIGMFMKNWDDGKDETQCTSKQDYSDVAKVCEKIDIPYYAVNFVQEYQDNVFKQFVIDYEAGLTPNPDILCNKEIKFKVFFKKAMELGASFLATGHYCQKISLANGEVALQKGKDANKDQTYFLYTIQQKILEQVLFPIGELEKSVVRKVAKDFDLITHDKKDSTGICFIGERNFRSFLADYIQSRQGNFVRLDDNKIVGPHSGQCFYTIGQRKGLGLGGPGGPWFVAKKDSQTNTVYVVEGETHPALFAHYLIATEESWVATMPEFPLILKAKIRYRQKDVDCRVSRREDGRLMVEFEQAQRAISLKQAVVFYQGEICLGGATIDEIGPSLFDLAATKGLDHLNPTHV